MGGRRARLIVLRRLASAACRANGGSLSARRNAPPGSEYGEAEAEEREALLAALNGVLGDYLTASGNPLAITMGTRRRGIVLPLERRPLAAAIPQAGGKLLVLLYGLCMNDLQWTRNGHDHGGALARDLAYTPVYLHYNSGLHISTNGRALAEQLEGLVRVWPVRLTELVLVGHSMGGLVARSACHYGALARHEWRERLDKLVFLGTPHHGAPLERGGNWVDILLGVSPTPRRWLASGRSAVRALPICGSATWLTRIGTSAIASRAAAIAAWPCRCRKVSCASPSRPPRASRRATVPAACSATGIVPLGSALGRHANPRLALVFDESRQWVAYGTNHLDLLSRSDVYAQIKQWLAA